MSSNDGTKQDAPRVFISYSHDSPTHKEQVRRLGELLRVDFGIDAHLDQWYDHDRRDWAAWVIDQIARAGFVLAMASPTFRERADGQAPSHEGRGSQFEGALLRNKMTEDRAQWIRRILPVVLPGCSIDDIPEFLLPHSATHYIVDELTPDGIADIVAAIAGQSRYSMPPLGEYRGGPFRNETETGGPRRPGTPKTSAGNRNAWIDNSRVGKITMGDTYHLNDEGHQ
jgi:SEFIR domain-containing protein